VLDVHALDRPDAVREDEGFRFRKWLERVPAAIALPHERRVEAFLDRRPDRERWREVVAVDLQVAAVAYADLVDFGEEVVDGVAGEDVGEPGLDAHADQGEQATRLPRPRVHELIGTEHPSDLFERPLRMTLRQVHREVEVVTARFEGGAEDRGLNRGSHAFTTTSTPSARARPTIASSSPASIAHAEKRRSSSCATARAAWSESMSATTTRENTSDSLMAVAIALPTPPAPSSNTRMI
jgi:hypothetical protein